MSAEQTIHLDRYAPDAKALVAGAQSLADERKHAQVEPIHLLARAIERDRGVQEVFRRAGADPADVSVESESQLRRINKTTGGLAYLSSAMLQLLARAEKEAAAGTVEVEHLLNALSQEIRGAAAAIASPTTGPTPLTKLKTPGGRPTSSMTSARMNALIGATSLGFSTTVQPAASDGATLRTTW